MKSLLVCVSLLAATATGYGNNIAVTDVRLLSADLAGNAPVAFDLTWDNSWRITEGPNNYDAAWVFVKYQVGDGAWQHATLTGTYTHPAAATVDPAADGVGAFVYRSATGVGHVDYADIRLQWAAQSDGVSDLSNVRVHVFAVEMVYVPQSAFALGSDGTETGYFYGLNFWGSRIPYTVESEGAIAMGGLSPELRYDGATLDLNVVNTIPAAFPKGYRAFYCMKYELSQQQYVEFFNCLTAAEQSALNMPGASVPIEQLVSSRHGMYWESENKLATLYPHVPLAWVTTDHIFAYLDWSGLRPMTELEYEKACRGTAGPVANEYAWGSNKIMTADLTVDNPDGMAEVLTGLTLQSGWGYALHAGNAPMAAPLRTGIFAGSGLAASREASGGSYYGIMELSGNLSEFVVTVGALFSSSYDGEHGDGNPDLLGLGDLLNWVGTGVTYGTRGGSFAASADALRVSDRRAAVTNYSPDGTSGFRGVRTADN